MCDGYAMTFYWCVSAVNFQNWLGLLVAILGEGNFLCQMKGWDLGFGDSK